MTIKTRYMERNDCYQTNRKIVPKGIMLHSTATPGIMAHEWFSRWNKSFRAGEINRQVCVHAFLDDKEVWQYLPWDHRGWHAGGPANNTHIGIEMCEPSGFKYVNNKMVGYDPQKHTQYFERAYALAVDLCAELCRQYNLSERDIVCHSEGYKLGIASNHGDVMHWFSQHHKTMSLFRDAVREKLNEENELQSSVQVLVKSGVLNTPGYWLENAKKGNQVNGEYAAILIKRVAAFLRRK